MKAKKHLAGLTASCMILTMLFGGAASADSVTVTADRLNIRKEASASSKAVGVVDQNEMLSFVSESGDWFQVRTGSKEGFVSKEFVALDMSQLEADVEANTEDMSASGRTTDRLNMRALPMTKADIVKVIPKNSEIDIIGACGVWYEVEFSGKTGYVMGQYLTEIEEDTGVMPPESNTGSSGVIVVPPETDTETAPPAAEDTGAGQDVLYAEPKSGETTARVNLRSAPTTASNVIKVVGKGDEVSLTGENGGWYKVNAGGAQGYLSKTYVEIKAASGSTETVPNGDTLYAEEKEGKTTERVNMRKDATTSSSIVKVINGSRTVSVTGENGSWYKVEYGGRGGYIAKAYLILEDANAGDAVIPDDFVSYPAARSGSTTTEVNLRDAASTSSDVVRVLSRNSSLTVMGEQGGFYQVKYGSLVGYISKEYVKLGTEGGSTEEDDNSGSTDGETIYAATKTALTTVKVNMRREPEGDVLFTLPQGTKVTLIGEKGSWYKATYSSSTGYISKAYVEEEAAVVPGQPSGDNNTTETVPDTSGEGETAYITAQSLNMRKGPGTGYSVIKVLYHGAEIKYYSLEDGWYLIKAGSDTGYVSQKYVSTTKPSVAPSQPENNNSGNTGSNDDVQVGKVQQADWWTSDIQKVFKRGLIATVTDVDTGLSWQVLRSGGTNHADVQPLTAADTAKMKQAYGGAWSWNRRAIWVTIDGVSYAASMNGMPHGTGSITTNNFDGHHCIHFLNSRTHTGNRWDTQHQAMVQKAYKAGQ